MNVEKLVQINFLPKRKSVNNAKKIVKIVKKIYVLSAWRDLNYSKMSANLSVNSELIQKMTNAFLVIKNVNLVLMINNV